ncbi:hypothetical protein DRQ50_10230 [bacterium]|nr:MAG: hypothetical protein DRQ50_10230 [bacterium]
MILWLRRNFLTGLVTLTPLAITVWVVWRFYELVSAGIRPWVQRVPTLADTYPEFFLNLVGLLAVMFIIALIGLLARNLIGIAFLRLVERFLERIPVVKSMYSGTKQIAEVLLHDRGTAFRKAVLLEYPRRGIWSLGFVTRENAGGGTDAVFLPTTPNPTSGYMLLVPQRDLRVLDIPVEQAIKLVVSGGSIMTDEQAEGIGSMLTAAGEDSPPGSSHGKDVTP